MRQAVILVGGKGTRLGALARDLPKPLLPIAGDKRFLDYMLENIARHGFEHIVLLAGHLAHVVEQRYQGARIRGAQIEVVCEPRQAGTAGALRYAQHLLNDAFLMVNGDSFFDTNYLALFCALGSDQKGVMALRRVPDATRFGRVVTDGARIVSFHEKDATHQGSALVSAGAYALRRSILDLITDVPYSIETDVFPHLAQAGALAGVEGDGNFIDIGLPETLEEARATFVERMRRGAIFFDRDGTLTADEDGYTHKGPNICWQPGAVEAIRRCNDAGRLVIVVTNQSGVARGYYGLEDVDRFHAHMQKALRAQGAHIDAFYDCPFHGDGTVDEFSLADHPDRKPQPGMLRRALLEWPIDPTRSFLIGDNDIDIDAARAVGIPARKVAAGDLMNAVDAALAQRSTARRADHAAELRKRANTARAWLFEHALPLWWNVGFDRQADCFHERLTLEGAPVEHLPRRIRVQARQTAVFAQAGLIGWPGPWREAALAGANALMHRGMREDGGSRFQLSAKGEPIDHRRDLYDLAFLIFGLSESARALGQDDILAAATQLSDWAEANWRHPAGGFLEGDITPTPPRRQNPHMHMFEAHLALHQASAAPEHLVRASAMAELFRTRLFDQRFGALPETFTDDWRAAPDQAGDIVVEPGHHFEWSWLLHRFRAAGGSDLRVAAERLRVHAEIYGVDHDSGAVLDQVFIDGRVRLRSTRPWPQTERMKANLARYEDVRDPLAAEAACQAFDVLFRDHLNSPTPGVWHDRRDAEGAIVDEPAPASSLYHVMVALCELLRVSDLDS